MAKICGHLNSYDFLDVEPIVPKVGVHACPGKNLALQQNDGKIENLDDFVLYTIGIFAPIA